MQTLWSRAARTPSTCRCLLCAPKNPAVARRAGGNSVGGAWSVFGTPTSTFLYTAMFTAGLVADMNMKVRRNKQWDAAFAALRDEALERTQPDADLPPFVDADTVEEESDSPGHHTFEGVDWDLVARRAGTVLQDDAAKPTRRSVYEDTSEPQFSQIGENLWDLLPFDSRLPNRQALEWPANTGRKLSLYNLPPQSLWSTNQVRIASLQRRHTWKKLVFQELSVSLLVHQMLKIAGTHELSQEYIRNMPLSIQELARLDPEGHQSYINMVFADIERVAPLSPNLEEDAVSYIKARLLSDERPRYFQDMDGDFHMVCEQMNSAIRNLLQDPATISFRQQTVAIAKICHNLLISSAAPDVQTFNILIIGMKRWRQADIVDKLIFALDRCLIRPNELTCSAILDHYIRTDQPDRFSRFVKKMRGVDREHLMLARPDINISEAGGGRLVRLDEDTVIQKVYPTPMVYSTLMKGALKFAGLDRALEIYYDMKEDGWGLDVLGLNVFLLECVRLRDWEAGFYIWEEINSIKAYAKDFHMKLVYPVMLALCNATHNERGYNVVLREVVKGNYHVRAIVDKVKEVEEVVAIQRKLRSTVDQVEAAQDASSAVASYLEEFPAREVETETSTQANRNIEAYSGSLSDGLPTVVNIEEEESKPSEPLDEEDMWRIFIDRELGLWTRAAEARKAARMPPPERPVPRNADAFVAQLTSASEKTASVINAQSGTSNAHEFFAQHTSPVDVCSSKEAERKEAERETAKKHVANKKVVRTITVEKMTTAFNKKSVKLRNFVGSRSN